MHGSASTTGQSSIGVKITVRDHRARRWDAVEQTRSQAVDCRCEKVNPGISPSGTARHAVSWRHVGRNLADILVHRAVDQAPLKRWLHDPGCGLRVRGMVRTAAVEAAAWERGDQQQGQQVRLLRTSECGRCPYSPNCILKTRQRTTKPPHTWRESRHCGTCIYLQINTGQDVTLHGGGAVAN